MDRFCIDASVFLSALLEPDSNREMSRRFFVDLDSREDIRVVVPATVAVEVVNVLLKSGHGKIVSEFLKRLPPADIVPIDEDFLDSARLFLVKINLKSADAIVAVSAALEETVLISWDRQLLREASRITAAMTPEEWMAR